MENAIWIYHKVSTRPSKCTGREHFPFFYFFEKTTTHQIEIEMSSRTHDGRIWFSKSRGPLPENFQHFKVIQPEWKQLFGEVIIVCEECQSATDHAATCAIGRANKAGKAPKMEIKKGNEEQKIKQIFQSNGAAAEANNSDSAGSLNVATLTTSTTTAVQANEDSLVSTDDEVLVELSPVDQSSSSSSAAVQYSSFSSASASTSTNQSMDDDPPLDHDPKSRNLIQEDFKIAMSA